MKTIKRYKKHNSSSFRNKHSKSVKKSFNKNKHTIKGKYKKYRGGIHPPDLKPLTKFNPLYNSQKTLKVLSNTDNVLTEEQKPKKKSKSKSKKIQKSQSLLNKIEQRQKRIAWLKMNRFKHL